MNNQNTVILVDDELAALEITEKKFNGFFPNFQVAGKFSDPERAIVEIEKIQPTLLLLDIQMPRINGFELLERLDYKGFELIFSTAYDQYSIKAFEYSAIGYLLKPFMDEEFVTTVNRALKNISLKNKWENSYALLKDNRENQFSKINIPTPEGFVIKEIENIIRIESVNRYSMIKFTDGSIIKSSYNIGKFITLLDQTIFLIPHQSHLINKDHILMYLKSGFLKLRNDEIIPISKSRKAAIIESLQI